MEVKRPKARETGDVVVIGRVAAAVRETSRGKRQLENASAGAGDTAPLIRP